MSLTIGSGPFGDQPGGEFNFTRQGPERVIFWEDHPRKVKVEFAGATVAESAKVKLLHETTLLPVFYFPGEDVDFDLLEAGDRETHCPYKGDARYWTIRVGGTDGGARVAENAVWSYPEPIDGAPALAGHYAIYWNAVDHWYEEDEEIFVHPVDPYHRVDIRRSSRRVRVELDGEPLAESSRPTMLFETGLPPRFYLPRDDVRTDLLIESDTHTRCPYKGLASYYTLDVGGTKHEDFVWYYPEPLHDADKIGDLLCFYNERVDLTVDGETWKRPVTKFS